jgi:ABC-type transporter MlaC component
VAQFPEVAPLVQIGCTAFDFGEMTKIALRPHWDKLTPQQQEEFVSLCCDAFEGSYTRLVLRFLGVWEVEYGAETLTQHQVVVRTTLSTFMKLLAQAGTAQGRPGKPWPPPRG